MDKLNKVFHNPIVLLAVNIPSIAGNVIRGFVLMIFQYLVQLESAIIHMIHWHI